MQELVSENNSQDTKAGGEGSSHHRRRLQTSLVSGQDCSKTLSNCASGVNSDHRRQEEKAAKVASIFQNIVDSRIQTGDPSAKSLAQESTSSAAKDEKEAHNICVDKMSLESSIDTNGEEKPQKLSAQDRTVVSTLQNEDNGNSETSEDE